jgi:Co/Zn/Cd efflux system component
MRESVFVVPKMDCPSEEQMIRRALARVEGIEGMGFDLDARTVTVQHDGPVDEVLERLEPLGFDARLEQTTDASEPLAPVDEVGEQRVLRQLLAINGVMFVAELGFGLWAQSTGLLADSLDMLADAMVYGLSLYAVGRTVADQRRTARMSGWLQLALALGVLVEVARRALTGSEPVEAMMIGVASVALVANLACVALLARHRDGGAHLKASWIFTTNDALANVGVIVAGVLVLVTGSAIPDLVVGSAVGLLVLSGAARILRM